MNCICSQTFINKMLNIIVYVIFAFFGCFAVIFRSAEFDEFTVVFHKRTSCDIVFIFGKERSRFLTKFFGDCHFLAFLFAHGITPCFVIRKIFLSTAFSVPSCDNSPLNNFRAPFRSDIQSVTVESAPQHRREFRKILYKIPTKRLFSKIICQITP